MRKGKQASQNGETINKILPKIVWQHVSEKNYCYPASPEAGRSKFHH
jgi:hypothetical protein